MLEEKNLTMLTDFYELTMGNGYILSGKENTRVYFDMFFRDIPEGGGFAVMAGIESLIDYMKTLHFDEEDIEFLRKKNIFSKDFLDYLKNFKFECDVWAVPEGTPIFPHEPIVTVAGPAPQVQLVETATLLLINHQSLIATKANRIVRAADGRAVMEFGSRRAQGASAAVYGARSAYIAGCSGTACTLSDEVFGIPALGTMAHSWVQLFDSEYEAFTEYAKSYSDNCVLLVDTFDTLRSGVPNAIKVFDEQKPKKKGIRIDSGDIAYLTKHARKMLDDAGHKDCSICVSNSLDENIIRDLLQQGACIDSFGVGERLITSKASPVFGGVYKMCAVEDEHGNIVPKIKISNNVEKITNPGYKKVYRLYDKEDGRAFADVITLADEPAPESGAYPVIDPHSAKTNKTITRLFTARELLVPLFVKGKCVYESPSIEEIRSHCKESVGNLWEETLRFENPHRYYVDLSTKLGALKASMLDDFGK